MDTYALVRPYQQIVFESPGATELSEWKDSCVSGFQLLAINVCNFIVQALKEHPRSTLLHCQFLHHCPMHTRFGGHHTGVPEGIHGKSSFGTRLRRSFRNAIVSGFSNQTPW